MQSDPHTTGQPSLPATGQVPDSARLWIRRARFTVPADLENVAPVAQALRVFIASHMPEEACNAIELGVVEALTNIVAHSYAGTPHGAMELGFEQSDAAAIVELIDGGKPIPDAALGNAGSARFDFDPTDIEHLPESGMGLSIIKAVFDVVRYESAGGVNRLTLAKRFGEADGTRAQSDAESGA